MCSRQDQLRAFLGQPARKCLRGESDRWHVDPAGSQWSIQVLPFCRSPSFFSAVRYYEDDWYFKHSDEGAVSFTLRGSEQSKHNFVIAITSNETDVFGYYIVFGSQARVFRQSSPGENNEPGSGAYAAEAYKEMNPLNISSVPYPLLTGDMFTFTYDHGHFRLIGGDDPNNKSAPILVEFNDGEAGFGNRVFGFGLFGNNAQNVCENIELSNLQKWSH